MNIGVIEKTIRAKVEARINPILEKAFQAWANVLSANGLSHYEIPWFMKPEERSWFANNDDESRRQEKFKAYENIVQRLMREEFDVLLASLKAAAEMQTAAAAIMENLSQPKPEGE